LSLRLARLAKVHEPTADAHLAFLQQPKMRLGWQTEIGDARVYLMHFQSGARRQSV
jgi:hypothetical protein